MANLITGAENINVSGGAVLTLTSAASGINYSVAGKSTGLTLTQAGTDSTSDSVSVSLKSGALGTLTLGDTGGVDFETINLSADGAESVTLTEGTAPTFADTGDKIVITGASDISITIDTDVLGGHATDGTEATIDGSGHTGALNLDLTLDATKVVVDAKSWTGYDSLSLGLEAINKVENLASGKTVTIDAVSATTDDLILVPVSGSAQTVTVALNTATAGTSIAFDELVVDGIETLTIHSTGADSSSATIANTIGDVKGLSTDTTLNISGDKKLSVTTVVEGTFTNITSTNTTGVDLVVGTGGALTFTGGSGADRIEFDTVADLTTADTLVGGDGTDTVAFSAVPSVLTAAQLARISGFEAIEFKATNTVASSFTLDLDETDINTVIFTGELTTNDSKALTIQAKSGLRIEMGGHTGTGGGSADNEDFIVDIVGSANAGTDDTVTLALANIAADDAHQGLNINNVENFIVEVAGDASHTWTIADIDGAVLQDLTIKSTNTTADTASDSLTITTAESTLLTNVDASAFTGVLTITGLATKLIGTGATVTGGSGVDNITGGSGADTITSNAGNDVLIGGAGNDAINGGAGADSITGGTGADTLTGGDGIDTFKWADDDTSASAIDAITDFTIAAADATYDKLDFATASTTHAVDKSGIDVKGATSEDDTTVTGTSKDGIVTFAGADAGNLDTFAEVLAAVELVVEAAEADADDSYVVGFKFGTDTYVAEYSVVDDGDAATLVNLVKLVGVTGVTAIDTTAAANTIVIA